MENRFASSCRVRRKPVSTTAAVSGACVRFNRQLHPDERQWAKDNAKQFAQFYKDTTGQDLTADQAQNMLLANGYRLVDSAASKGPGGDATAVAFISQNAGGMFTATTAEYNSPFLYGNKDGSLTPEQRALPGAVANPKLGLAIAGALATPAVLPALAAIPGAPILGADGLLGSGALASRAGIGVITGGVNATSQYLQNGSINPIDVAYAAIAGTAGTYGGLGWNVFVNGVTGAADTATNNFASGKNDSIIFGGAANAAAAALGYGAGKVIEGATNAGLAPSLSNSGWASAGRWSGPSGANIFTPNNLPAITSGIAGAAGSEGGAAAINNVKSHLGK